MPTAEDFRNELFQMMANAQKNGRDFIEISARELHARVIHAHFTSTIEPSPVKSCSRHLASRKSQSPRTPFIRSWPNHRTVAQQ
jgi:hypothetical protein